MNPEPPATHSTANIIVTALTLLFMLLISAFWLLTMFIGLDGPSASRSERAFDANVLLTLLMFIGSGVVSWRLFAFLAIGKGMSPWLAAPLIIIGVPVCSAVILFIGGLILADLVGFF